MKKTRRVHHQVSRLAAALLLAGCGSVADSSGGSQQAGNSPDSLDALDRLPSKAVCAHVDTPGMMHCHALVRTNEQGAVIRTAGPTGLGATDLRAAYSIPATGGAGKTIAIVDAMDNPNLEADLAVYRAQYGLPPCTTANGCFKKVNQSGQASPLPAGDTGWGMEEALDVDMASAACPDCNILVVEANTASMEDLGAAVIYAASVATVVSNSYGGTEDNTIEGTDKMYFDHPGVGIFVSSGDSGYGVSYPASSQYVTAVGGTKLVKASNSRGWTETVWGSGFLTFLFGGAGSGCSAFIPKPAWQKDPGCTFRTVADVSANAAPGSGPAIYDTYGGAAAGAIGWVTVGGTSASSPLVAGIYAITGNGAADGSLSYSKPGGFFDVSGGSNGSCKGSYLCTGVAGYDGPTGNGSPNGAVLAQH